MATGAIVSELPLGTLPRPLHFPLRNRIISGLSRAVVVVEARRRSGSLITVRHALNQGREVFVVPGAVEGPFAAGTNQLLREGARAIQSARDLLDDLGIEASDVLSTHTPADRRPSERSRSGSRPGQASTAGRGSTASGESDEVGASAGLEARLEALLADGPRTADELLLESGGEAGPVATALLELELAGRIASERDGRLHLCGHGERRASSRPSLRCRPPAGVDGSPACPKAAASDPPKPRRAPRSAGVPAEDAAIDLPKLETPP